MRRSVLFLVVLLLVLRGWTGDALALQAPARAVAPPVAALHCAGAVNAVHAAADAAPRHAHRHGTAHGPTHPHPPGHGTGDAASALPDPAADGSPRAGAPSAPCGDAHAAHGGCGDCQVCHSAVPAFEARVAPAPTGPQAAPACGRAAFASADRAPDLRPPIVPPHRP